MNPFKEFRNFNFIHGMSHVKYRFLNFRRKKTLSQITKGCMGFIRIAKFKAFGRISISLFIYPKKRQDDQITHVNIN